MFFIVNKNIPAAAQNILKGYGEVILFETDGITDNEISNHPDIFFCVIGNKIVCAQNTPKKYIERLNKFSSNCTAGNSDVGYDYPANAKYNAVITDRYIIHNKEITDEAILQSVSDKKFINVKQGYTRCNLLPLKNDCFITSDRGIENILKQEGLSCLYVSPKEVLLPGFKHGFFGGACGVFDNSVFILGSLNYFSEGNAVKNYLTGLGYELCELVDGKLFDGGSILIV